MTDNSCSVPYRAADYLDTPEAISEYLNSAMEDGDDRLLPVALRNAADAVGGMGQLARASSLSRESLYRTLSDEGNPRLSSLLALLHALGLELAIRPRNAA